MKTLKHTETTPIPRPEHVSGEDVLAMHSALRDLVRRNLEARKEEEVAEENTAILSQFIRTLTGARS